MALRSRSPWLLVPPQRRCEAWSFAICPPTPRRRRYSILNEGAKRGASQSVLRRLDGGDTASSTKVRSVELRNPNTSRRSPSSSTVLNEGAKRGASQSVLRRLDGGDTASSTKVRSVELRNLSSDASTAEIQHPQRRCEAWSFAICPPTPRRRRYSILNEGAKRGASQFEAP